jgi:hypothetical protein
VTADDVELIDVVLVSLPVEAFRRSQQHHDALLREFALVAADVDADRDPHVDTVPRRLLSLVSELAQQFGRFSVEPSTQLRDAIDNGVVRIDVHFRVPAAAKDAAINLGRLLDEADEYCRRGDLLTLATPTDTLAFRRRYLEEFVRQIDGAPARPWQEQ